MVVDNTGIQWTNATWGPVTGCTKVSAGCKNCYAEAVAKRFWGDRKFTDVRCHEDRLDQPLRWTRPRRVFVNSMSDLFHDAVPDEFIDRVFAVMALAPRHTFQVLTKRPQRMRAYMALGIFHGRSDGAARLHEAATANGASKADALLAVGRIVNGPLPNVWLGVSVENQAAADERIPLLLQTPAAVRFLSCEPLLEDVTLGAFFKNEQRDRNLRVLGERFDWPGIDWVIAGGESGPEARACDVAWIRSLVQQCKAAEVPCFVKQMGAVPVDSTGDSIGERFQLLIKDRKGGDPAEWPEDLRVREFPRPRDVASTGGAS